MRRVRLIRPTKTGNFNRLQRLRRPDKRSASGKFADKVHFVYAGCGVYALSGLQKQAVSIDCRDYVGLISASGKFADKVHFVYAGCGVYALSGLQKTGSFNRLQRLCRPDKHSASGKFADKAHFVYAGCGVYALSGLQKQAVSIDCRDYVGLINAAHQANFTYLHPPLPLQPLAHKEQRANITRFIEVRVLQQIHHTRQRPAHLW